MAGDGKLLDYSFSKEGDEQVLRFDCEKAAFFPSLEDNGALMAAVIDALAENITATRIIMQQKRDYEYDYVQTNLLRSISKLKKYFSRQRFFMLDRTDPDLYVNLKKIFYNTLRTDPVGAYHQLVEIRDREGKKPNSQISIFLSKIIRLFESAELIGLAKKHEYKKGSRSVYRQIFTPTIKPDFMFTKLMASYPVNAEEIDSYADNDTEIAIFKIPDSVQKLYHINPPEFRLSEDKYEIIDQARQIISEHKPEHSEFVDPERIRTVFYNVGSDLIDELSSKKEMKLRSREIDQLAEILVRYTIGFGLIEILLQDQKVQDITINSPMGTLPAFIVHQDHSDCSTNIIPTANEGDSWATKLRLISGRPLDEANPILDTELSLPNARSRVAAITSPLNPSGLAYAFRRHRDKPWTLPLFVSTKMMTPLAAGLISFLVDGSRTMLVAGTRSAGKTSLLGSLMTEVMRKNRLITIEDTLELPVEALKKLNYNIQSLKVAGALSKGNDETDADAGIRSTLRLGDSGLIVGEVRSTEARALYESMRVGALANIVAGTIHGDSPYGIFDRVVNDLEVPKTSFKATDIILIANPLRSADGLSRYRRLTQITEVGKYWENDPQAENGFVDLMKYNSETDRIEPTNDLISGDSEIMKSIAANVKEWAGSWDAVWENVSLRAKIKEALVKTAAEAGMPDLLEAEFVVQSNDEFHSASEKVKEEVGGLDSKRIFFYWNEWLKKKIRGRREFLEKNG